MKNDYGQNSCLMVTSVDDETNNTVLTYIPLSLDLSVVDFFLKNGTCENKNAYGFDIDQTEEDFWKTMWADLEGQCEWD